MSRDRWMPPTAEAWYRADATIAHRCEWAFIFGHWRPARFCHRTIGRYPPIEETYEET